MSQSKDDKNASRPTSDNRASDGRAPEGRVPDGGLPKRPVPTIDLKATEVKIVTTPFSPGTAANAVPGAAKPGAAAGQPAPAPTPDAKTPSEKPAVTASGSASTPSIGTGSGTGTPSGQAASRPNVSASTPPPTTPSPSSQSTAAGKTAAKSGPTKPAPAQPTTSGGGIGRALSYLSAAVLGGLLAIFGADFMAGTLGLDVGNRGPAVSVSDGLAARIAKLERAPSDAQQSSAGAVKALSEQLAQANDRLAKLETANRQLAALSEAQARLVEQARGLEERLAKPVAEAPETARRIATVEETIQMLAAAAQAKPGQPIPEMARLATRLAEAEAAVAALRKNGGGADAQTSSAMAQIEARLAEARKAEARTTETVTRLQEDSGKRVREIEAVKTQAERLEGRIEAIKSDAGTARSSVDTLKSDVTAQLQTVARQGDIKATLDVVDKRVAGLESKVETMAARDDEREINARRLVVSLQLANLKRDIEQGKPFEDSLAAVETVAGGTVELAPLKALRTQGAATTAQLNAQFRTLTRTVLETEQDKARTSTVDRLLQSAKSVVHIRRTGPDVTGDTAEATLARAEHHLKAGDLELAAKELKGLKPELRLAVQGWLDQLEARVTVDRTLKAIEDKLKTSMAGAGASRPEPASRKDKP